MEAVKQTVLSHLKAVQTGMALNMTRLRRTASGRSVASLEAIVEDVGGEISGYILGSPNWAVMQQGRRAGKVPMKFREIIKDWILAKGINYMSVGSPKAKPETKLNSLSYLIARSIMLKGTKLFRDKGYNDIYDTLIAEELEKMAEESAGYFEIEVDKINDDKDK